ncbi:MAG: cytochrome P450 [Pseudomonadota bacterium]
MKPALSDISLFSEATLLEPYEAYQTLRDEAPVYFVPEMNLHVITRYELVREAIRNTRVFSSQFGDFLAGAQKILFDSAPPAAQQRLLELGAQLVELPPTMLTLDEPEHTRYRSLVAELFTASRIRAAQDAVAQVINETIDTFAHQERIDFMSAFANPVPLLIIGDRLGVPRSDRAFFDHAATEAAGTLRLSPLTPDEQIERAETALALQRYLIDLIEARRSQPEEDMISQLANSTLADEGRPLTHGECLSILNQFLVAGHETTTSAFGWGMLHLAGRPDAQASLRGDAKRTRTFVEEALRLDAPVQGLPRLVTQDTTLGGVDLPAGSMVMLRFGAANRDERQFPEPDVLDLERPKAGAQLAFGSGVHHCIGAPLARQELNLGFAALFDRIDEVTLDTSAPPPQAEPSFVLRNLPHLPLTVRWRRS